MFVPIVLCLLTVLTDCTSDFLRIVWQLEDGYFPNGAGMEMCYCDS
jgi:hypothetical protein